MNMVQANELRVGNRFIRELHNSRGLEYDHDFVLNEEWMGKLFGDNISIALQDLFPIPLTPEVLEKSGFDGMSNSDFWEMNDILIGHYYGEENGLYYEIRKGKSIQIKYVHQLQNLIHSLTGEELEIKL